MDEDNGDEFETAEESLLEEIEHELSSIGGVSDLDLGTSDNDLDVTFPLSWHEQRALLSEEPTSSSGDNAASPSNGFTVEEAVEHMGFGRFQIKIFFICGLYSATDALEMLLLSVLSPVVRCEWFLSDFEVPLITTIVFIGMFLGSAVWGSWADKYGRLSICYIASVWIAYFGILTAFSPNYIWLVILRGLVGLGFGGAVQGFTLMAEYMPSKYRAKVLIIYNFMWAVGSGFEILMAYLILPTLSWRWLVGVSALPMLITIGAVYFLPESARYLLAAGRKNEALMVLQNAARENNMTLPPGELLQGVQAPRGRLVDMFSSTYWRTTLLSLILWFGTAFSYYGIVLLNSELLEKPGYCGLKGTVTFMDEECHCNLHTPKDYVLMIVSTVGEFFAIPFNILTIDTLGRKWTIAINYLAAGVFFLLLQICGGEKLLTVFMFGVRAFTAGIFNVVYIYTTEVYPTTIRSLGLGISSSAARIGAMITPFVAQGLLRYSTQATLWVYGSVCIICSGLALLLPIETKGREMHQSNGSVKEKS